MRALTVINVPNAPPPGGHYCHAVTDGQYIHCSGVIALDENDELVGQDARTQATVILKTLETIIEAAGSSMKSVIRSTVYVTDMRDFKDVNEVYSDSFGDHKPARCTVAVSSLPRGALVEIDATAITV